jgi:hypothetical protein
VLISPYLPTAEELNAGLLATQVEIDELTAVLGHAPRTYEAFIKEVLPA